MAVGDGRAKWSPERQRAECGLDEDYDPYVNAGETKANRSRLLGFAISDGVVLWCCHDTALRMGISVGTASRVRSRR